MAVPQGNCKTELLLVIGDPSQTILSPAIGTGTGLVMTEIVPRIPVRTIVFANGTPLPFTEIRTPLFPRDTGFTGIIQAFLLIRFSISNGRLLAGCHVLSFYRLRPLS